MATSDEIMLDDNIPVADLENIKWQSLMYQFHSDPGVQIIIFGFACSFALSFAVGANDSANSWGTSVGAGTLSLGWAYFLGSLMETIGATLLSGNVIKKLASGVINVAEYRSNRNETLELFDEFYQQHQHGNFTNELRTTLLIHEKMLAVGCLSVMLGSALWQLVASLLAWPVSGSHSIVSGLLGFTLAAKGLPGVGKWFELVKIVVGWVTSPLISMILTLLLYYPLYRFVVRAKDPFSVANRIVYSILVWLAVGFNFLNITVTGSAFSEAFGWKASWSEGKGYLAGYSFLFALVIALVFLFAGIPALINVDGDFALTCGFVKTIKAKIISLKSSKSWKKGEKKGIPNLAVDLEDGSRGRGSLRLRPTSKYGGEKPPQETSFVDIDLGADNAQPQDESRRNSTHNIDDGDDSSQIMKIFRPLQVLSACTGALAHGGNDVGNCVGPLVLIYFVFMEGIVEESSLSAPLGISLYGGFGISMGLIFFGKRVIHTMGTDIARMTPSRGFCVEWMAAVTVLICGISKEYAIPVSTTHCQVGSLIGAGIGRGLVEFGLSKKAFSFVNFKLLGGIAASWVATIPFTMGITAFIYYILALIIIPQSL